MNWINEVQSDDGHMLPILANYKVITHWQFERKFYIYIYDYLYTNNIFFNLYISGYCMICITILTMAVTTVQL